MEHRRHHRSPLEKSTSIWGESAESGVPGTVLDLPIRYGWRAHSPVGQRRTSLGWSLQHQRQYVRIARLRSVADCLPLPVRYRYRAQSVKWQSSTSEGLQAEQFRHRSFMACRRFRLIVLVPVREIMRVFIRLSPGLLSQKHHRYAFQGIHRV